MDEESSEQSLENLGKKIKTAQKREEERRKDPPAREAGATRVSVELMAGVAVGAGSGFFIDKWLGTLPIFFIICFFFGVAAGGLNIYKLAAGKDYKGFRKKTENQEKK